MYHRIGEPVVDPWGLAVSPRNFAEHLAVLRRRRQVLSADDFVARWETGELPASAVAITFDDGYVDNLEAAVPRLEAAEAAATIFLTTGFLGTQNPYWWDELAELILLRIEAQTLDLTVGELGKLTIGRREPEAVARRWRLSEGVRTERQRALVTAWALLRDMDFLARQDVMTHLRHLGQPVSSQIGRPMTVDEARTAARSPMVTIGAHTVSHPSMVALPSAQLTEEVATSHRICEEIAGQPVLGFAYPFGNEGEAARTAVERDRFNYAFGVDPRVVQATDARFALPRIQARNMDADSFDLFLDGFE